MDGTMSRSRRDRAHDPQRATTLDARAALRAPHDAPLLFLPVAVILLVLAASLALSSPASALSFQLDFRSSTYQTLGSDTFDSLLLQHQGEALLSSQTVNAIDGVSSTTYAGTNQDYSTLVTTTFTAGVTGTYVFEVGTDWGRGGATQAVHVGSGSVIDEFVTTADIWWNNSWTDPDVFSSVLSLTAGETYTISWIGFEDCCGGAVSFRFSVNGSPPATLDDTNFAPYEAPTPVPEPRSAMLLALGLLGLGICGRPRA